MNKIYNLLYILVTVFVISVILYAVRYYFGGEGFLDLPGYCGKYPESKRSECLSTTLSCGFKKWSQSDQAQVSMKSIPSRTLDIVGKDSIKTETITLSTLSDLVVKGCIKKYGSNKDLVNYCAMENMSPIFVQMVSEYGKSSNASDYLVEPDCKEYSLMRMSETMNTPSVPAVKKEDIESMIRTSILSHIQQLH